MTLSTADAAGHTPAPIRGTVSSAAMSACTTIDTTTAAAAAAAAAAPDVKDGIRPKRAKTAAAMDVEDDGIRPKAKKIRSLNGMLAAAAQAASAAIAAIGVNAFNAGTDGAIDGVGIDTNVDGYSDVDCTGIDTNVDGYSDVDCTTYNNRTTSQVTVSNADDGVRIETNVDGDSDVDSTTFNNRTTSQATVSNPAKGTTDNARKVFAALSTPSTPSIDDAHPSSCPLLPAGVPATDSITIGSPTAAVAQPPTVVHAPNTQPGHCDDVGSDDNADRRDDNAYRATASTSTTPAKKLNSRRRRATGSTSTPPTKKTRKKRNRHKKYQQAASVDEWLDLLRTEKDVKGEWPIFYIHEGRLHKVLSKSRVHQQSVPDCISHIFFATQNLHKNPERMKGCLCAVKYEDEYRLAVIEAYMKDPCGVERVDFLLFKNGIESPSSLQDWHEHSNRYVFRWSYYRRPDASIDMMFLNCVHHPYRPLLQRRDSPSNPNPINQRDGKYNQNKNGPDVWYLPSDIPAKENHVLFVKRSPTRSDESRLKDKYLVASPIPLLRPWNIPSVFDVKETFIVQDCATNHLPESTEALDLYNELEGRKSFRSLSFDTRRGILRIKVLNGDEFEFYQANNLSACDGVKFVSSFSFEGNEYIYGLEDVGLSKSESPGVCVAVVGTEDALPTEVLQLKYLIGENLDYDFATMFQGAIEDYGPRGNSKHKSYQAFLQKRDTHRVHPTVATGPGDTRDDQLHRKANMDHQLEIAIIQAKMQPFLKHTISIAKTVNPDYMDFIGEKSCSKNLVTMGLCGSISQRLCCPYGFSNTRHTDTCDEYSDALHQIMESDLEGKDPEVQKKLKEIRDMFAWGCPTTCCYRHVFANADDAKAYKVEQDFHFRDLNISVEINDSTFIHFYGWAGEHQTSFCSLKKDGKVSLKNTDNIFTMFAWGTGGSTDTKIEAMAEENTENIDLISATI